MSPALLILDYFAPPLLVDQQMLLASIADFGTYKKNVSNRPAVEKIIWEMYSRKKSRGPAADGSDPDAMEVASKSALEGKYRFAALRKRIASGAENQLRSDFREYLRAAEPAVPGQRGQVVTHACSCWCI